MLEFVDCFLTVTAVDVHGFPIHSGERDGIFRFYRSALQLPIASLRISCAFMSSESAQ